MKLTLVAAVARGGVIGRDGTIPWRLPEDMKRFRELTFGHAVLMGRKTWESIPERFRPLPGRRNVVVTRDPAWAGDGAERAGSPEEALGLLEDEPGVFVIGGAEVYAATLPLADELALTEIDAEVEGDTFFPEWDRGSFDEVARDERTSEDGTRFAFVTYVRKETGPERHYIRARVGTTMERMEVGIRELRLNLSRYVARVRTGVEVIVTDRGHPVARLGPIDDEQRRADEVYERLVREGLIIPGHRRRKRSELPPPIPLEGEGPLLSEMVLEDRR